MVRHVEGPLEIQAGHGTGKTTLLLERLARLVKERLAWPYEVLLLTFTRRAALELRERLQLLLDEDTDDLPILTLHEAPSQQSPASLKSLETDRGRDLRSDLVDRVDCGLQVLVGALKVLGLEGASQSFAPRLAAPRQKSVRP